MHFVFAGYALSSADRPASNVRIAGSRVVDEVDAVLSASKRYFGRGNRSTPISFDSSVEFSSFREAEIYALTLNSQLPEVGTLEVICGDIGDL